MDAARRSRPTRWDNPPDRFIADTSGWMMVQGIYNARGGERYVRIGNFQLCDRTSRKAVTANQR